MTLRPALAALVPALFALLIFSATPLRSAEELPYLGNWSNGRGETLVITAKTIRFADNRALPYKDVTRATDGTMFELQITSGKAAGPFGGNTLGVECEDDSMKITAYASHADYMQGGEPQSIVTWFRDEAEDE
jgi:hypothetical protein